MSVDIYLVEIKGNEIPQNAEVGRFKTFDGIHIRYAIFKPIKDLERGCVSIFTGRSEPIEKYFETIKKLQNRGFSVAIMDWRGQGLSDRLTLSRRKGHVKTFDNYVKDALVFMQDIVQKKCKPPYSALAHSTGSSIITQLAATKKGDALFEKIILVSPFYKFETSSLKGTIIRIIAGLLTVLGMGEFKATFLEGIPKELKPFDPRNLISSSRRRMKREQEIIKANEDLALGAPTFGWLHAAFNSIKKINDPEFVKSITTEILVIMGTGDYLVSQSSIRTITGNIPNAKLLTIEDGKHELLMEKDKMLDHVWVGIDEFYG